MNANPTAKFRFYEELNDFLSYEKRKTDFQHSFAAHTAVKDIIESLGVPHTEVDLILVNGQSVDFSYQVKENDYVSVYPTFESLNISTVTHLRPQPLRVTKFVLDVHLGKLARYLRLLGFDTLYERHYSDVQIAEISQEQKRIVLTRDVGLLKNKKITHGFWLRNTDPKLQLKEVVQRLDLSNQFHPFVRCLECNGKIVSIPKESILEKLPNNTKQYYDDFYQCSDCQRIYWEGSHFQKLKAFIQNLD